MHWFYYTGRLITHTFGRMMARWEVAGLENVPREGPLLIIANHLSVADPPLIGAIIPRKMMFMAKEELFRSKFAGYFIGGYGAFPVHRDRADRKALRQADRCLRERMALVMFPEGTRSSTHELEPGLPGCALMAARSGAPLLPGGISGTERIKGKTWWLQRPRVRINIGQPFHLPETDELTRKDLMCLTDYIMRRIAALLPPEYRGQYGIENEDRKSQDRVLFRGQAGA